MCFIRDSHQSSAVGGSIELIAHNADPVDLSYADGKVELSMFHYRKNDSSSDIVMVHVYNHPSRHQTIKNFESEFDTFMERHSAWVEKDLVLFGDFNIDFNLDDEEIQRLKRKLEKQFRIKPTLSGTPTRPKSGRQIDWVFSSDRGMTCETSLYSTWFSDHQPLVSEINFFN